ncbi:histidinol-phosphate aminotransferase [Fodinibius salicampi]
MIQLESEQGAIDFTQKMLEEGVILRRLHAFGLPACIRITVGRKKEMEHFKHAFKKIADQ